METSLSAAILLFTILSVGSAFKERFSAPRAIHIMMSKMICECDEDINSKCGAIGYVRQLIDPVETQRDGKGP